MHLMPEVRTVNPSRDPKGAENYKKNKNNIIQNSIENKYKNKTSIMRWL